MTKSMISLVLAMSLMGSGNPGCALTDNPSVQPEDYLTSYQPVDKEPTKYVAPAGVSVARAYLPEKYDARTKGYVTSVKDQNPYGTCWTFAAMAAIEGSALAQGLSSAPDYSELQLGYFFYHHVTDPLGGTKGDITTPLGSNFLDRGGNNWLTMFALTGWLGATDEKNVPYSLADYSMSLDTSLAYKDDIHVQNVYDVSMYNRDDVKTLLMNNGVLAVSVNMDTSPEYFNWDTYALYTDVFTTNHAVSLIGWDDNFSRYNFVSSNRPEHNGAWLIKNSWGEDFLDYFWVSYEDFGILSAPAFAYVAETADNYDYNYQYDGTYGIESHYYASGTTVANVFTISGANTEELKAVGIGLNDTNVNYSVQIYKNPAVGNPLSGTKMLSAPVTGRTTYDGYYTIKLPQAVTLNKGDSFTVAITVSATNADSKGVWVYNDADANYGWIELDNTTEKNQSFVISNNGAVLDLHSERKCNRIKAYTNEVGYSYGGVDYSLVFDSDYYISKYADIKKAFGTNKNAAFLHFVNYGIREGRQGNADFDVKAYKNANPDLRSAFGYDLVKYYMHYINFGCKEGRVAKDCDEVIGRITAINGVNYADVYNYEDYTSYNPDVKNAFGTNDIGTLLHFVNYGMNEGRCASSSFELKSYKNANVDLRAAFGMNNKQYYMHYINFGKKEGRTATNVAERIGSITTYNGIDYKLVYDFDYYEAINPDVEKAFGSDDIRVMAHFVNNGMNEARLAKETFDVKYYQASYPDLQKAFGNAYKQYYLHYINFGYKEERKGAKALTQIMGTSALTVDEMVAFFEKQDMEYSDIFSGVATDTDATPTDASSDFAPTIEDFCKMYKEECESEGVDVTVAFAQAMMESNFLSFEQPENEAGQVFDVKLPLDEMITADWYNFARLTYQDEEGIWHYAKFATVREGIRAHVQRLKAFSSKSEFVNECVDPGVAGITRGVAPYVEWLGVHENPRHEGFSNEEGYGARLIHEFIEMLIQ